MKTFSTKKEKRPTRSTIDYSKVGVTHLDDGHSSQTNYLIAIQSKIYEFNYKKGDPFSREQFLMSYAKAMLRVLIRVVRQHEFTVEQGKQVLMDLSLVCDLLMDSIDKEEEGIVHGFYHGISQGIRGNCEGDCSVKTDKLALACTKKRSGTIRFVN